MAAAAATPAVWPPFHVCDARTKVRPPPPPAGDAAGEGDSPPSAPEAARCDARSERRSTSEAPIDAELIRKLRMVARRNALPLTS